MMKVGIITCMICMFSAALTIGGQIRRQTSQSQKIVHVGGNVTLLCPFSHDDAWIWVYWKKDDLTVYALNIKSDIITTNDTRYEGSNHATNLTISHLEKKDSGMYHCKVATNDNTPDFIGEGGHVLLSVTDQEGGLSTTYPVPFRDSTTIPPKRTEDIIIILSTIVSILLLIIIVFIALKYRKRIMDSRFVRHCLKRVSTVTDPTAVPAALTPVPVASTPVPAAPNHENLEASTMTDPTPVPAAPNHENVEASTMTDPTPVPVAPNLENAEQRILVNISDQADISSSAQDSRPTTSKRLYASVPSDLNVCSTPLFYTNTQLHQGSRANIRDQANISLRAQYSRPTTFRRLDASAPRDLNSPSTPLLDRSAEQGSPANNSDEADISVRAPDSTTSSRLDASAPRDQNSSSTPLFDRSAQTSERGGTQLPLVGPVLIDDLCRVTASKRNAIERRMTPVLHYLVKKNRDEGEPPKGGGYSASLRKYASSGNRCVPNCVLEYVEYCLDELDNIPVGFKRDVCEILLTMPQNQEVVASMMTFTNKDTDDQVKAASHKLTSRTPILTKQMRNIIADSETRDAARYDISLIILDASPVKTSGSGSFSQQTASRYYQPANETGEETGVQSQGDADLKHEDENLIEFWLSKVIQLDPAVQRTVSDRFAAFNHDADSSSKLQQGSQAKICVPADISLGASDSRLDESDPCDPICCSTPQGEKMDRQEMTYDNEEELKNNLQEMTDLDKAMGRRNKPNTDAKEEKSINLNDNTILEPQPSKTLWPPALDLNRLTREQLITLIHDSCAPTSNERVSAKPGGLKDEIKGPMIKQIYAAPEEKAIDAKELKNTHLKKSTELNKKGIKIPGEKEKS